jgi:hypothetical protein
VTAPPDPKALLRALQADLPSHDAEARIRQRLVAASIVSAASVASAAAEAVATTAVVQATTSVTVGKLLAGVSLAMLIGGSVWFAVDVDAPPPSAHAPATRPPVLASPALDPATPEQESLDDTPREMPKQAARKRVRSRRAEKTAAAEREHVSTLGAEGALLARALEAMQRGDFAEANRLLDEHEQRFSSGTLQHERQLARKRLREVMKHAAHFR